MRFATITVVTLVFVIIIGLFAYRASQTLAYTQNEGKMTEIDKNAKAYYDKLYRNRPAVFKKTNTLDTLAIDSIKTTTNPSQN